VQVSGNLNSLHFLIIVCHIHNSEAQNDASSWCCVQLMTLFVQIRLFTGEAVTQKFSVREPLAAVRLFAHGRIVDGQIDGDIAALTFTTSFPPRRVFTEEDMMAPLSDLGRTAHVFVYLCSYFISSHFFISHLIYKL